VSEPEAKPEGDRGQSHHIASADATFQQFDALRTNRRKRRQRGAFLVHGVRAIDAACAHGWPLTAVLAPIGGRRSAWARRTLEAVPPSARYELAPELFDALTDRDAPSELIAVAAVQRRDLDVIVGTGSLIVLDRPANPGNLGTVVRSADAFGAAGVVVLGHAADVYDPRAVRASVGSVFVVPVVEVGGPAELAPWLAASGRRVVGLDEDAKASMQDVDRDRPVAVVIGNEGRGLAVGARALCDELVSIPMRSTHATSLNMAVAASIALYELHA
jgi:TrmH family RNA methyltransferase